MSTFNDEFTVPDNYSMNDIKRKVMSWNASYLGKDYIIEVRSERHVILTKSKHDLKLCFYPCLASLLGLPVMFMLFMSSPYTALFGIFAYIAFVIIVQLVAVYMFCLNPKKAEYTLTFSHEIPIHVRVVGVGEMHASAHEYRGLKDSLYGGQSDQGVGLGF